MTDVLDERAAAPPHLRRRRRRWPWLAVGAAVVAGIAFILFWFQPQKLFIDDRVDEPIPTVSAAAATTGVTRSSAATTAAAPTTTAPAAASTTTAAAPTTTPATAAAVTTPATAAAVAVEPAELARGTFVSRDHGTSGVARVLELADGQRIVRLEDLETDNGPDLFVYLTTNPADGDEGAFDDDYVNLGRLKGNIGNQNYDLPEGTDLSRFASLVIWCDRFDSAFGAAELVTS